MANNQKDLTRRKFITGAATGLAAIGMAPALALADDNKNDETQKPIIKRKLGKSGIEVPIVSMGVMNANMPGLVQASYEVGMRHFDTAAAYQFGSNEQMVGSVLNKMGVRKNAIVATKIFTSDQRADLDDEQARKKLMQLTDGSLSRLKFDYVDILYIHNVRDVDIIKKPGVLAGLADIKASGKARMVGISTHSNMAAVINETAAHDIYDVILTAINFTMAANTDLLGAIDKAAQKGLGVVAMKTMAGGGRWPDPDSRQRYSQETIINAAMKWVMKNESIATSIPGYENYDHMNQDFAIARDLTYTDDEKKFLKDNQAIASIGFCHQCRKCLAACPNDVDIPKLMRTHMYAAQYSNFQLARNTLNEIPPEKSLKACIDCSSCLAKCANSVDIGKKIDELKLIYA
jgi:predicted aldo/keto reductase-like oxidoreductase